MDRGATVHWVTKSQIRLGTAATAAKSPQPHCAHVELGKECPQKNTEQAGSRNAHPSQPQPKRFPESPNNFPTGYPQLQGRLGNRLSP